jgi:hypothetical protein
MEETSAATWLLTTLIKDAANNHRERRPAFLLEILQEFLASGYLLPFEIVADNLHPRDNFMTNA